jgi:acetyl-CoA carboxylase carboxyl transferase subunit beta
MQEGTVAFVGMVKITAAITRHKQAGLPYLVYLRHPTTGGVLASWGSLGHVTVAEPGALVGFLGPRVYEVLYGEPFPPGVQVAENLYRHGLLDAVLPAAAIPEIAHRALNVLCARQEALPYRQVTPRVRSAPPAPPVAALDAWDSVRRSRRPQRPGVRHLLRAAAHDVTPLNGTGEGEADPGLLLALARFGDAPAILLGQDRLRQSRGAPFGPAGLRSARRGIRLAHDLGLPLVTVIDTPGAALSREAEEGGLAGEIARTLADLTVLTAPTVCLLLGQGSGGGALALLPADRVLAAQHGWLSPLPPEGASAILYRDTEHAPHMATRQRIQSVDLQRAGIVDRIVPEHPDAAEEGEAFCRRVGAALEEELVDLLSQPTDLRLAQRHQRYRTLGL